MAAEAFKELLQGKGTISHQQAINKAEQEFARYRAKEMKELESDFDRMIRQLEEKQNDNPQGTEMFLIKPIFQTYFRM